MRFPFFAVALSMVALFPHSAEAVIMTAVGPAPYPAFGSETRVTLTGTYDLAGESVTTTLANGDTKDTSKFTTVRVITRDILDAMVDEGLIASINGYSLVMVAHGHVASEVRFFATHKSNPAVEVPLSLLNLMTLSGPTKGTVKMGEGPEKIARETRNFAQLRQGDFVGTAVLVQRWTSKSVNAGSKSYPEMEYVELVTATGKFQGSLADDAGVGTLTLNLAGAKAVSLERYDMAIEPRADPAGPINSPVEPWGVFAATLSDDV
jgi:hypothetical protein